MPLLSRVLSVEDITVIPSIDPRFRRVSTYPYGPLLEPIASLIIIALNELGLLLAVIEP
ncbi:hypothetical protein Xind_03348 [Xenorhabdus indica]|nr:hypothetical protein [Xenorhabdus indica]